MAENFTRLFGNEGVKDRLVTAINASTLPHAFLIVGSAGSGKKTLVREIAMALNCERKGDSLPCHSCNTCKRIERGNFTDIYTLKRESGKASIGVEEVRGFKASMMLSPVESDYKIYIIEEAERLTVQAQNALLTFLEEPPRNTYIFLLAGSADTILTTIKSRAQLISMSRFEKEEMEGYIASLSEKARNIKMQNPDAFNSVIMNANGVIGRAISVLEDGNDGDITSMAKIVENISLCICSGAGYAELYSAICLLPSNDRKKFISALESLILAIRDIILCRFDENCHPVFYATREAAIELSRKTGSKKLIKVYDIVNASIKDASSNVSIASIITSMATKIKLL